MVVIAPSSNSNGGTSANRFYIITVLSTESAHSLTQAGKRNIGHDRKLETNVKNMKALLPSRYVPVLSSADVLRDRQNAIEKLLNPLLDLAENSHYLVAESVGEFLTGGDLFQIPRFAFIGPTGGGDAIRLGIFAAVHGDESQGTAALIEFLERLESRPRLAKGYHLYVYPICNPTGFIAQSRENGSGGDLSTDFWRGSSQPEIHYLEREPAALRFHGVISIHLNEESDTFSLRASSEILNRCVVDPAIQTTQQLLPVKVLNAEAGKDSPPDFLPAGELDPVPFEIHTRIPRYESALLRINGTISLLNSILDAYRSFVQARHPANDRLGKS
jgi:murein peptide amidase A